MSSQEHDTNGQVVTTVRLPREQHERFRKIAEAEHRSFSGELRLLIDRHIESSEARQRQLEREAA